jgi:hypothetical protein
MSTAGKIFMAGKKRPLTWVMSRAAEPTAKNMKRSALIDDRLSKEERGAPSESVQMPSDTVEMMAMTFPSCSMAACVA